MSELGDGRTDSLPISFNSNIGFIATTPTKIIQIMRCILNGERCPYVFNSGHIERYESLVIGTTVWKFKK